MPMLVMVLLLLLLLLLVLCLLPVPWLLHVVVVVVVHRNRHRRLGGPRRARPPARRIHLREWGCGVKCEADANKVYNR
jgi:hypothetical protein